MRLKSLILNGFVVSRPNRITKNYYFEGPLGRGSIWTLWLTPVLAGPNDIYFAGSGYKRKNATDHGFFFHLSIHKDGRAHIKHNNQKIHKFILTNATNFPICSVFSHAEDLTVPPRIPNLIGDVIPINAQEIKNPNNYGWIELYATHLEDAIAPEFLNYITKADLDFQPVEQIPIGQNRSIHVLARYLQSTSAVGAPLDLDPEKYDRTNRLTVWGYKEGNKKKVNIHDFACENVDRINKVYKSTTPLAITT